VTVANWLHWPTNPAGILPEYRGRLIKHLGRLPNDLPEMPFYQGRRAEYRGFFRNDQGFPAIAPGGSTGGEAEGFQFFPARIELRDIFLRGVEFVR
jgi:hypothetical protein